MHRFSLLAIVLLPLGLFGAGVYLLLSGHLPLGRLSVYGPLARLAGLLLILGAFIGVPVLLRALVGMGMALGR